jgi:hypothetical protein
MGAIKGTVWRNMANLKGQYFGFAKTTLNEPYQKFLFVKGTVLRVRCT